jgi:hypothetical protein
MGDDAKIATRELFSDESKVMVQLSDQVETIINVSQKLIALYKAKPQEQDQLINPKTGAARA